MATDAQLNDFARRHKMREQADTIAELRQTLEEICAALPYEELTSLLLQESLSGATMNYVAVELDVRLRCPK